MQTHELLQFCEVSRGYWHGKCCRLIGRAQELSTDQIAIRRALATCAVPHDARIVTGYGTGRGRFLLGIAQSQSARNMSALPPIATELMRRNELTRSARNGLMHRSKNTGCKKSFNHLVSAGEHRRREAEADRLGRLEVDHQLVLGGCLHRQVGRLLALEDAIDVVQRRADTD